MHESPPELQLNVTTVYLLLGRLEQTVTNGFEGINERLDALNGQTKRHGEEIAVLMDRSAKAETKTQEAADVAKVANDEAASVKGKAAKWSALVAGVLYTLVEAAKALWQHAPGQ
jgi:hypothetical protein